MKIIEYPIQELKGENTSEFIFELRFSEEPMPRYAKMLGFTMEGFYFTSDSGVDVIGPYSSIDETMSKRTEFFDFLIKNEF